MNDAAMTRRKAKYAFHGKTHYFRGTSIIDAAILAKQDTMLKAGLRPTESDIILHALLASPDLFPAANPATQEAQ